MIKNKSIKLKDLKSSIGLNELSNTLKKSKKYETRAKFIGVEDPTTTLYNQYETQNRFSIPGSAPYIVDSETTTTTTTTTTSTTTTTTTLPPTNFISTWRTTTPNESITLPYSNTGAYSGTIDWGDSTTSVNSYANRTHTYATAGDYTVTITGGITEWSFGLIFNPTNSAKIISVTEWGDSFRLGNQIGNGYFNSCSNLDLSSVTDLLNLTGTTSLYRMFSSCTSLTTINRINEWDFSAITIMYGMFYDNTLFNQDISSWNTSNITNMAQMFRFATAFNQNIGSWNVSNVTNMNSMFDGATAFNQNIGSWDVSNVTDQYGMSGMFYDATSFNQNISGWNVSNVTDTRSMFTGATSFNQNISGWNVSSVTDMSRMFENAIAFNQNLSSWCVPLIATTPSDFATGASAWVLPKPIWGTCPTTTTTTSTTTTTTTV